MENYNFTAENIDEINTQKSYFFSLVTEQSVNLVDLGVINFSDFDLAEKTFWTKFMENHTEIRLDIRLSRHFILKKEKIMKELKSSLFMSELYSNLLEESKIEYWKFMHTVFLLFETTHNDKNDAIINTLTTELEKIVKLEQDILLTQSLTASEVGKSKSVTGKFCKKQQKQSCQSTSNKLNTNKMSELLGGVDGFDMNKMSDLMGGANGFDMDKISDLMGGANGFNLSKMMNMVQDLAGGSKNMEDLDMSKMLNAIMPGFGDKKNDSLMNNLMNDITDTMGNLESSEQIIDITKQLGEKYQNMIISGEVDPTEIVGSLMGLMTDEKFTGELSKIDLSKINPEEIVMKMMEKVSPDILGNIIGGATGNMNLSDIGSLISGLTTTKPAETDLTNKTELSTEQLKEMEDYYSNLQIE